MSKSKVLDFFETSLQKHGVGPAAVGCSEGAQSRRFDVLCSGDDFNEKSILDFGSGLGHLYPFLLRRFPRAKYFGVDLSEKMVHAARGLFPEASFHVRDVLKDPFESVDFVLANGVDNIETGNNEAFMRSLIARLFPMAKVGLKVTMLSAHRPGDKDPRSHYFDPESMLSFCFGLTRKVVLRHDYLPNDFALFLYHE